MSATEDAEVWEAEAEGLENQLAETKSLLEAERSRSSYLEEQWSDAALELDERRDEARERRSVLELSGGPQQGNLEVLIKRLLPRIDLDPEAIDCLLDWPNPWPALQILHQLDQGLTPAKQKAVEGKEHWWEVFKINTGHAGRSDRGRIYWAPTNENRVVAYLQWKEDDKGQDRFIRNLPARL